MHRGLTYANAKQWQGICKHAWLPQPSLRAASFCLGRVPSAFSANNAKVSVEWIHGCRNMYLSIHASHSGTKTSTCGKRGKWAIMRRKNGTKGGKKKQRNAGTENWTRIWLCKRFQFSCFSAGRVPSVGGTASFTSWKSLMRATNPA